MVKIAWCAGHGLNTAGKQTPDGEKEWKFNNIVGLSFQNEISKYQNVELKRMDDPTGKTDVSLKTRTDNANKWGADYYISFHHNANTSKWGAWTGVETFTYTNPQSKSIALAKAIHPSLVKGYGLKDRGIKQGDLHIVRETKMPAILVEGGFMDSTIDIKVLRDSNKLKKAGVLIAQALANHLGLKLKVTNSEVINNNSDSNNFKKISEDTLRIEAIKEIKSAVSDGRFTSKHSELEKYDNETLKNYMLIALSRRK